MKLFRIFSIAFLFVLPISLIAQKKKAKSSPKATATKVKPTTVAMPASQQPFQLLVNANGFADSMNVSIRSMSNQQFTGPEGTLKDGKVFLEGKLPITDGYAIVLNNPKTPGEQYGYPVFISNSVYKMEIDKSVPNVVKVLSGNADAKAFAGFISTVAPNFMELNQLGYLQQQYQQMGRPTDSINRRRDQIFASLNTFIPQFIARQPASLVSAFAIKMMQQAMKPDQLQRNIAMLQGEAANDAGIQQMVQAAESEKMFAEGNPAPEFSQSDTLGKAVALSSFKGKFVLIDFWASWCGPCRMENPNVVAAFNQYKDKGFTVLGVSLDKDRNKWIQAIHDDGLTWTHVSDLQFWQNAVAQQYRIQSIPQNLLIGPDGRIVAKNLRGEALDAALKDLIK